MPQLKIISGTYRSRRLLSPPPGDGMRPYLARVRRSVFDMLQGWVEGASVLDLFAGVGTIGLEAVSRGAARVLMVEKSKPVYELLRENVRMLACGDRAATMLADALGSACLQRVEPPLDLAFLDPPYELMRQEASRTRVLEQAARVRRLMGEHGYLILRSPLDPDDADLTVEGMAGPETHRYRRDMFVLFYEPVAVAEPRSCDA